MSNLKTKQTNQNPFKSMLARELGFDKYNQIQKEYKIDPTKEDFVKAFDGYYDVREDKFWRDQFFDYFNKQKNNKNIDYKTIIYEISEYEHENKEGKRSKKIEASYASKMLATINPEMPVLDKNVLTNLGLDENKGNNREEKIKDAISKYNKICDFHNQVKKDKTSMKEIRKEFEQNICVSNLSDSKIIDYLLWKMSKDELNEIEPLKKHLKKFKENI